MSEISKEQVQNLMRVIEGKASDAYCEGMRLCSVTECLGAEAKMKAGEFRFAELVAHEKVQKQVGRHVAYSDIYGYLRALVEAKDKEPGDKAGKLSGGLTTAPEADTPGPSSPPQAGRPMQEVEEAAWRIESVVHGFGDKADLQRWAVIKEALLAGAWAIRDRQNEVSLSTPAPLPKEVGEAMEIVAHTIEAYEMRRESLGPNERLFFSKEKVDAALAVIKSALKRYRELCVEVGEKP